MDKLDNRLESMIVLEDLGMVSLPIFCRIWDSDHGHQVQTGIFHDASFVITDQRTTQ